MMVMGWEVVEESKGRWTRKMSSLVTMRHGARDCDWISL
jgi:hypothetical protein